MATIMEGALWTLTEAAAERMVNNGLIKKCESKHSAAGDYDLPIYHRDCDAPDWFGFSTMDQAIRAAEAHVTHPELKDIRFMEMTLDPTMNPEPGGAGSITVISKDPDAGTS